VASKRPYGTGSLTETPKGSGKWLYKVDRGTDPLTGRRRRVSFRFEARSPKEANLRANRFLAELETSTPLGSRATVDQLLAEFMRFSRSRGRSPTTLREYQRIIDAVLGPSIGSIAIDELTPHDLDSAYVAAMEGAKPVSPSSVRRYHSLISAALNQAVKWGWLEKNPASRVTLPEISSRRPQIPTREEVRALISACRVRNERLGMLVLVAAVTGCRRGEIAALRWTDLTDEVLTIRASAFDVGNEHGVKATKTGKERVVMVDPLLMQAFGSWRARCENEAGSFGVSLSPDSFIFSARLDGARPVNVHTVSSGIRIVADSIGLRHVHIHSLRHFAATELLGSGMNVRDTADRLGHADPSVTLRTYAHATTERQRQAALIGGRILEGLDEED
jgi:integrase